MNGFSRPPRDIANHQDLSNTRPPGTPEEVDLPRPPTSQASAQHHTQYIYLDLEASQAIRDRHTYKHRAQQILKELDIRVHPVE